ncbi:MAG TPA: histidine phosphatase family protein [Bryobacteraceae bacterium]|nr:histidine phosphatase family protein [Bryobacteraceae bacterium]
MNYSEPPMEVYLLRHGIAENGKPGSRDADRALTPEGKDKLRETIAVAGRAGLAPSLILTSPYRRAVETARIAAERLKYKNEPLVSDAFLPDSTPDQAWNEIRLHKDADQLLIAGHEPLLGYLTAYLLGAPSIDVDFKKGAIVRVDLDRFGPHPRGTLKWMLTPKLAARDNL